MKAVVMPQAGPPEVLQVRELEKPALRRSTDVLVRLMAAGVNPLDAKLRGRGTYFPDRMPAILGCDGAGVVEAAGRAVDRYKVGDAVYFFNGGIGADPGTYAEYAVVDERFLAHKPQSLTFVEAAAVPLVLITAYEALFDRIGIDRDQHLLVHGGAGGVGHIAVQLAANAAARVAATVSSDDKADFVTGLGATEVIRYRDRDVAAACRAWTRADGVDAVLDTVGGATFNASLAALRPYGHLATLLEPGAGVDWKEARLRNLTVSFELMLVPMLRDLQDRRMLQTRSLDWARDLFDTGKLRIHVSRVYPLEQAAQAHRDIERGSTQGKIVLHIGDA